MDAIWGGGVQKSTLGGGICIENVFCSQRVLTIPSIPKDKLFWIMNLKSNTLWKIDPFVKIAPEISFEISGRTWCYSSKIDLFITIAPEKFRSKYLNIAPNCAQRGKCLYMLKCFLPCERIFPLWKWTFFLTSPPSARSAKIFLKCHWTITHFR